MTLLTRYSAAYASSQPKKSTATKDAAVSTSVNAGQSSAITDASTAAPNSDATLTPNGAVVNPSVSIYVKDIMPDVIAAILAGTTIVTRRVEFYESDGKTLWVDDEGNPYQANVIDGSIGLSASGDARRSLDLTLDNSDRRIKHDPDNGLWYDKIIKVFRGIQFAPLNKFPKFAIINETAADTDSLDRYLTRLGFSDFTFLTNPTLADVVNFDIIAAWSATGDLSIATASLLAQAYGAGKNIFTATPWATSTTVPLISSTSTRSATGTSKVSAAPYDTPFAPSLASYSINNAANEKQITGIRSTARIAAKDSTSGNTVAVFEESSAGARWFHYHLSISRSTIPSGQNTTIARQNLFLISAINWLFNYNPELCWETQVGTFMIDKIATPNFPHQIQITGRDYAKKLDLYKFPEAYLYPAGTDIADVFAGILYLAGLSSSKLDAGGQTLNEDLTCDQGSSALEAFNTMAQTYDLDFHHDPYGSFILSPVADPATSPATMTIKTGNPDGNLVTYAKGSDDSELYNWIVVPGEDGDGNAYYGEAKQPDGTTTSFDRVGIRVFIMPTIQATSDDDCAKYAKRVLAKRALEAFQIDFSALVFPWLEVDTIVEFVDPDADVDSFPDRLLLTDGSIPLGLGPMTGTGKRVAIVS